MKKLIDWYMKSLPWNTDDYGAIALNSIVTGFLAGAVIIFLVFW